MYTRVNWRNGETGGTPLNADNLNQMDEGIKNLDTEMINKQNKLVAGENISIDEATNTISSTSDITEAEVDAKIAASEATTDGKIAETEARLDDKITHRISANAVDTSFNLPTVEGGIKLNKVVGKSYKSKNLLNVTMATKTINGVTCTNNGNGTYTLKGTASAKCYFHLVTESTGIPMPTSERFKIIGCPQGSVGDSFTLVVYDKDNPTWITDRGVGGTAQIDSTHKINVYIQVVSGTVCNNLVFKPMITTDLTATYDDFEPYGMWSSGEKGFVEFDGSEDENWALNETATNTCRFVIERILKIKSLEPSTFFNSYDFTELNGNTGIGAYDGNAIAVRDDKTGFTLRINKTIASSVSGLREYLRNNKLQIAYEVAEGQTPSQYAMVIEEHNDNLLEITVTSQTINGVTFTVNSDGTVVANGTATANVSLILLAKNTNNFSGCKLIGSPSGASMGTYRLYASLYNSSGVWVDENADFGNGVILSNYPQIAIYIQIISGQSVSNLVFKPMVTTNLSATYDSFVKAEHNTTIIPLSEPLRSVGDVKDEIDVENKQIIRRVRCRDDLSTLAFFTPSWWSRTDAKLYQVQIDDASLSSLIISKNFNAEVSFGSNRYLNYVVDIVTYPDVATFKSKLSSMGEEIIYELATPTTEPLTDEQINALHNLVSYEGKTYIDTSDVYAKATLSLEYASHRVGALALLDYNLAKINELISADNSIISDKWVQKTYQPNEFCIYENSLWKCLVANSVAPSEGANWTRVKVTDAFKRPQLDYANKQGWSYGSYTALSDGMLFVGVVVNTDPDNGGAIRVSIQGFLALSVASSPFGNSGGSCYVAKGEIVNINRMFTPQIEYIYFVPFK